MVYFIGNQEKEIVKIGVTSQSVEFRLKQLQTACPYLLSIEHVVTGASNVFEKELHVKFNHLRLQGEWFTYNNEIKDHIETLKNVVDPVENIRLGFDPLNSFIYTPNPVADKEVKELIDRTENRVRFKDSLFFIKYRSVMFTHEGKIMESKIKRIGELIRFRDFKGELNTKYQNGTIYINDEKYAIIKSPGDHINTYVLKQI